ncbi:MAG: hypothetical protein HY513_01585 [Candidatus Aenigmarchaeota archaeon]|nr:hypothetical protein [Candidatus Aenigmarchaeota archaeon]
MDKQLLVEELFKKGKLVTPTALELLASGHKQTLSSGLVITEKNVNFFKVVKQYTPKDVVTTSDFIAHFNQKYEKLKQIIINRISKNFISLDKLSNNKADVFVIGIVKNIEKQAEGIKLDIEDLTGTASVYLKQIDDVDLDDVIAIQGVDGGKNIYNAKILFPDVPLKQPAKNYGKVCFISGLGFSEAPEKTVEQAFQEVQSHKFDMMFVVGSTKDCKKFEEFISKYMSSIHIATVPSEKYPQKPEEFNLENITPLTNPSMVEVNGIKILAVSEFRLGYLRKRQLRQPKIPVDPLVIDDVPDVVVCCFPTEAQVMNYKATTVINVGSFLTTSKPVIIDLETRDVQQINLRN